MKKAVKGTYGYIHNKRNQVLVRTIIFFAISIAIFIIGYVTTGTRKNLLTVVAVLGCLPACKSLVNLIMFFKAKGCSSQVMERIRPLEGHLIGMYDMFFTSYQKNFAISHMVVEDKIILAYTEEQNFDLAAYREHLETMLKQSGFKDMTITVSTDLNKYCEQLQKLNEKNQETDPVRDDEIRVVLYDISL
ncbi:MAG: hypothetical protein PUG54_11280 [Firmicutes bacterium]|nr:hypothetical protein [Bacillota bacterium]